jgi:hypothetical protein
MAILAEGALVRCRPPGCPSFDLADAARGRLTELDRAPEDLPNRQPQTANLKLYETACLSDAILRYN